MTAAADRRARLAAVIVLALTLAAVVGWTTPWSVIPGHVPGGAAPTGWRDYFSPALHARENAYRAAVHPPSYAALLLSLAVTLGLGFSPLGARLTALLARPVRGHWVAAVVLGAAAVVALAWLVALPFDARAHVVARDYGLTHQGWGGWAGDRLRNLAVSVVPTVLGVLALFALARRFPRRWWLPTAVGAGALTVLLSFAYPLVVEPVFNTFHRMPSGPLRTSLLQLARADGVPVQDVLVADASRRTTSLNAYVSGFGSTRRIVVYDTLLASAPPDEVRLIVAHELGHATFDDVLHGTAEGALGATFGIVVLSFALSSSRVRRAAGVTTLRDGRAVALVIATVTVLSTLSGPVQNLVSRHIESRADWHALQLTGEPGTFQAAMRRLAERGLANLDPAPLTYVWFTGHPTPPQRMAMAVDWERLRGR